MCDGHGCNNSAFNMASAPPEAPERTRGPPPPLQDPAELTGDIFSSLSFKTNTNEKHQTPDGVEPLSNSSFMLCCPEASHAAAGGC